MCSIRAAYTAGIATSFACACANCLLHLQRSCEVKKGSEHHNPDLGMEVLEKAPAQAESEFQQAIASASEPQAQRGRALSNLAAWLQSGPAVSLAVFSFQAAALSTTAATAQAVSLSVDRISLHLGAVKSASRPGSVTSALLALRNVPVPRRGFRASLGAMQLGVATLWLPQASREGTEPSGGIKVSHTSDTLLCFSSFSVPQVLQ